MWMSDCRKTVRAGAGDGEECSEETEEGHLQSNEEVQKHVSFPSSRTMVLLFN